MKKNIFFFFKYLSPVLIILSVVIFLSWYNKSNIKDLKENGVESICTVYDISKGRKGSYFAKFYYINEDDTIYSSSFMSRHKGIEVGKKYRIVFSKINPENNQVYFD